MLQQVLVDLKWFIFFFKEKGHYMESTNKCVGFGNSRTNVRKKNASTLKKKKNKEQKKGI